MKKTLAIVFALVIVATLCFGLVACNKNGANNSLNEIVLPAYDIDEPDYSSLQFASDFKVGLICLHDENSTYDLNFINAMKDTQKKFGLSDSQVIIATNIEEGDGCYQKACQLADQGCDIIFADSFGHEAYMIKAAKDYPAVQFCHATGTKAHTEGLDNYGNAFASIYEGRYLAGVAAGMKLNEMIAAGKITAAQAKMGYVGAYTYAEVMSGYSSFYLGAKSVCPSVTMEVTFTGSWYDVTKENQAAKKLLSNGCVLISQHADSMGAPNACEEAGVPNVSYNGSTLEACENTFIISSRINWSPYYEYAIAQVVKGQPVAKDWVGTIKTGSVVLTNIGGNAAAEGTKDAIIATREKLVKGQIQVYDLSTFTVNGKALTEFIADVDDFGDYEPDQDVVKTSGDVKYIAESVFRSAPYFNLEIDGIKLLDRNYG